MAISTILKTVYASAPSDIYLISTIEIQMGANSVRLVHGYEDMLLGVDGVFREFESCAIDIALPEKNTSGNQSLSFAIGLIDNRAWNYVNNALENGIKSYVIYREYLSTDLLNPAKMPIKMAVEGGQFNGISLQVDASYYDMLNTAWPRERYTVDKAPGIKYMK